MFLIKHTKGTLTYACRNSFICPLCVPGQAAKQFPASVEEIPTVLKTPTAQISKYRSPFTRQDVVCRADSRTKRGRV